MGGSPEAPFFPASGEIGALMRATDWSMTPVGRVETWSAALRMMVSSMMASRFPLLLLWGPNYIQMHNDACRQILGKKHLAVLGCPARECWRESWRILQPLIDTPFNGGPSIWSEDLELQIERSSGTEETHFAIEFSPVPDETAPRGIGGVLATMHEITTTIISERRGATLCNLGVRVWQADTAQEVCTIAAEVLAKNLKDIPFSLLYLTDPDGTQLRLSGSTGIDISEAVSLQIMGLGDVAERGSGWPAAQAVQSETMVMIEDLANRFLSVPPGPWPDPPTRAVLVPLRSKTAPQVVGLAVIGVSSRMRLDDHYRSFLESVAAQIASASAGMRGYEINRAKLRQSEERLQAAVDLVGLSLYSWEPETGAVQQDARLKVMWGLPPQAHMDEAVFRAGLHPDDRPRVEAAIAACIDPSGDGPCEIEYRVIGITDGVERWISMRGRTIFDKGRPVRFIGAALDITRRKRAEAALRESEERFRKFVAHSTDVLWLLNVETSSAEFVSPAFERIWGAPVEAMCSPSRWIESIHPGDRERVVGWFERVLKGEDVVLEYRIVRPDGAVRWIRHTLFPVGDGPVQRVGGSAHDITQYSGSQVYIVDANEASRRSLTLALQSAGYQVKAFTSSRAFLHMVPALTAGCVVVDIRTPGSDGLSIPFELKVRRIQLPVIVLGDSAGDIGLGVRAMKGGAADFLNAPYENEALMLAVATTLAATRVLAERDRAAELTRTRIAAMSERERQVLDRMLLGGSNKSIAKELGISPRTVESHRARLMDRLGAKTLAEAVLLATAAELSHSSR